MDVPLKAKIPMWATREFRWLIIIVVMSLSILAVLIFEIAPMTRAERPPVPGAADPAALLPGEPAASPGAKEVRFDGILEKVKDSTPIEDQDQPYRTLVRHLARIRPEALAREARRIDYGTFTRTPSEVRGATTRILALFLESMPLRLDPPEGGVEWLHRTYLMDLSGSEGFVVDLVEPPPAVERRQLVSTDGVFLKIASYEGRKGSVQAPFFLGRSLRLVKEARHFNVWNVGSLIVAVAVLSVVAAIYMTMRLWRKARSGMELGAAVPRGGRKP